MNLLHTLSVVFFVTFFTCSISFTQEIPNNSFEFWTGGDPDNWSTTDFPPVIDAVTQTSDAWEGSSAALMSVIDVGGLTIVPLMEAGDILGLGIPVSERYGSFGGYYKFNPVADENFNVAVNMLTSTDFVGAGGAQFPAASNWTEFNVPIQYTSGETPTVAILGISVANTMGMGTVGTTATVDFVMFGAPTDVEPIEGNPVSYSLTQNYPNPFNPSTFIEYSIPEESFVELKVYDILGNEIATLVSEQQPAGVYRADFNADNKPAGLYFAQLTSNDFTKVIKMILLK